jgi:hypothetical protein
MRVVARIFRAMTMAIPIPAPPAGPGDRACAEISQIADLLKQRGSLLFQLG